MPEANCAIYSSSIWSHVFFFENSIFAQNMRQDISAVWIFLFLSLSLYKAIRKSIRSWRTSPRSLPLFVSHSALLNFTFCLYVSNSRDRNNNETTCAEEDQVPPAAPENPSSRKKINNHKWVKNTNEKKLLISLFKLLAGSLFLLFAI
jgi:hypothetical protein